MHERITHFLSLLITTAIGVSTLMAADDYPKPEWKDLPNPFTSEDAVVGGTFTAFGGQNPNSFNYYLDNNTSNAERFGYIFDSLLSTHPVTLKNEPLLASKWQISDDKRTFTFWMDNRARWSDGKPVTAHDVKWTFDVLTAPETLSGAMKLYLGEFDSPKVIDDYQIQMTSSNVHWRNLDTLGGIYILPRHVFQGKDFNKIQFDFPVVSGRYKLGEYKKNQYSTIERRKTWWAQDFKRHQNLYNFQIIKFRYFESSDSAFESFSRGDLDLYRVGQAKRWIKETRGEKFDKNWIVKQKVVNSYPTILQGWVMNTRAAPFDDMRVRKAMQLLCDREGMNKEMMYSQYTMSNSYYQELYSENLPCKNKERSFDPDAARKLLSDAGWTANAKTGLVEKDGKPFSFTFLSRSPSSKKFLERFQQNLKDVGVTMTIDQKDWSAWVKEMNTFNFQMSWATWYTGVKKDPESLWHSSEANRPSGNNYPGFSNSRVDKLIDQQKLIFDINARHKMAREIDALIYTDVPYVLLWHGNFTRLLYWNKFGTPQTVLGKYTDEASAYDYWWLDEDAAADLEDARESGDSLPRTQALVEFEKNFQP